MKSNLISASNVLDGKVLDIERGRLTANVTVNLGAENNIFVRVNIDAIDKMELKIKDSVYVIFDSDAVILAKNPNYIFSAQDIMLAKVSDINKEVVLLDIGDDIKITAKIDQPIGLEKGDEVYVILKANSVILAKEYDP
ncbi:MAG: TOBE domain-containing protein [Methanosarcinales archaeon]